EREYDREYRAEVQAESDESQSDCGDREDVHLHAVQQLTTEEPGQENADGWDERRALERIPERCDQGDEGSRDDDEIEQDERQQVRPSSGAGKLIRDWTERAALLPDRQHHRAVVLKPSDEEVPADNPQERGEPAKCDPDEWAQNGPERRDALELVTPKHVPTHRKVLDAVHVHVCRRRLLRVGAPNVPIDPLPISPVRDRIQSHRDDDPQKRSCQNVDHGTSSRLPEPLARNYHGYRCQAALRFTFTGPGWRNRGASDTEAGHAGRRGRQIGLFAARRVARPPPPRRQGVRGHRGRPRCLSRPPRLRSSQRGRLSSALESHVASVTLRRR